MSRRDTNMSSSEHETLVYDAVQPDEAQEHVGRVIDDRYEIVRWLGQGAMGEVYEVKHLHLGKRCALKMIHEDLSAHPELIERFKREAKTCSVLEHPNCIAVTDFGEAEPGRCYLVMEYLEGRTLAEMRDAGLIDRKTALEVTRQVLLGLEHAHGAGIIHRDIKLENVMKIRRSDDVWQLKILDFGLAKALSPDGTDAKLTKTGLVVGTPNYMAPEQISDREVDGRADLYAAGILLIRMLTDHPVFPGETPVEVVQAKLRAPAPSLKDIAPKHYTPALEAFLKKALERDPNERFEDAAEMRRELESIIEQENRGKRFSRGMGNAIRSLSRRPLAVFERWYCCAGGERGWKRRIASLVTTKDGAWVLGAFAAVVLTASLLTAETVGPETTMVFDLDDVSVSDEKADFLEDRFLQMEVHLEKGQCPKARKIYEEIDSEASSTARGKYLEGRTAACLGKAEEALAAYGLAVELDPGYRDDPRLLELAQKLLRKPKKRDAAMTFLKDVLRDAALPTLIDMAGHHLNKKVRKKARQAVVDLGAEEHVDQVAALELDLRQTRKCKEKKDIVQQIAQIGGPDAVAALKRARDARVKDGFFSERYVHGCARREIIKALKDMSTR